MAKTVRVDQLANEIANTIRTYTEDVTKGIEKELNEESKNLVKEIAAGSPVDTGEYKSGRARKQLTSGGAMRYIIYCPKTGSIAHLLELGHAKGGGGRVSGRSHTRPPYGRGVPSMERRIGAIIQRGG